MKLPREVEIRIQKDGRVEIVTHGFKGSSCVELSEYLEKQIAGDDPQDVQRELQPEYYLNETDQNLSDEDRLGS